MLATIGMNLTYGYFWMKEYQITKRRLIAKQDEFQVRCSVIAEYADNEAQKRECGELQQKIIEFSDPLRKSFLDTAQILRLCGKRDCIDLFGDIVHFFMSTTNDVVWGMIYILLYFSVILFILSFAVWLMIGGLPMFKKKKKKKILPQIVHEERPRIEYVVSSDDHVYKKTV